MRFKRSANSRPSDFTAQPRHPDFKIEDRGLYLYIEYRGNYDEWKYLEFFNTFIRHPKFGELPIVQASSFGDRTKDILPKIVPLYTRYIPRYSHRWALVTDWQVYHWCNSDWQTAKVDIQRKMFTRIEDAESWVLYDALQFSGGGGVPLIIKK